MSSNFGPTHLSFSATSLHPAALLNWFPHLKKTSADKPDHLLPPNLPWNYTIVSPLLTRIHTMQDIIYRRIWHLQFLILPIFRAESWALKIGLNRTESTWEKIWSISGLVLSHPTNTNRSWSIQESISHGCQVGRPASHRVRPGYGRLARQHINLISADVQFSFYRYFPDILAEQYAFLLWEFVGIKWSFPFNFTIIKKDLNYYTPSFFLKSPLIIRIVLLRFSDYIGAWSLILGQFECPILWLITM
jgi:hypothetical protein